MLSPVRQQRAVVFDTVEASGGSSKNLFLDQEFNRDNACDKKARSCSITIVCPATKKIKLSAASALVV